MLTHYVSKNLRIQLLYYFYFTNEESDVWVDFDILIWFKLNMLEYLRQYVPVQVNIYGDLKNGTILRKKTKNERKN